MTVRHGYHDVLVSGGYDFGNVLPPALGICLDYRRKVAAGIDEQAVDTI